MPVPDAVTANVAVVPAHLGSDDGCDDMDVTGLTFKAAPLEVISVPQLLPTTTVYVASSEVDILDNVSVEFVSPDIGEVPFNH